MTTSWTGSMAAVGMALMLVGTGIALGKPHGDGGPGKGHGRGGKHGDPAGTHDDGERGERGNRGDERGGGNGGPASSACEAASSVIQAFVDGTCPCDGVDDGAGGTVAWKNHGQYVRCVARAVREAARAAGVKRRCGKSLVPCAARSTCGKKRGVTCVVTTGGACAGGACGGDPALPCTTDADCATSACGITSAERCAELGGTAGTGSCCAASPSGAHL